MSTINTYTWPISLIQSQYKSSQGLQAVIRVLKSKKETETMFVAQGHTKRYQKRTILYLYKLALQFLRFFKLF